MMRALNANNLIPTEGQTVTGTPVASNPTTNAASSSSGGGGSSTTSSVSSPSASSGLTSCFSNVATVQTLERGIVAMNQLQVGEQVLTQSGSYETVYAFGHYHPTKAATFLQIQSTTTFDEKNNHNNNNNNVLEITGDHLVFLQGKTNPVRADSIRVGDILQPAATVTKIDTVDREGIYAPLTTGGTVVVNNIVASSYVSLQTMDTTCAEYIPAGVLSFSHHAYTHLGLAPFRLLCQGVSSSFGTSFNEETGMPFYAHMSVSLTQWALHQQHFVVQALVFAVIVLLTGACWVVEATLGATWGPTILVLVAGLMAVCHKRVHVTVRISSNHNKTKTV